MKKMTAEKTLEELMGSDALGILGSMSDEQIAAMKMAYQALKNPECMTCGYCQRFVDETAKGDGRCEHYGRIVLYDDLACPNYE